MPWWPQIDEPVELRAGEHPMFTGPLHLDEVVGLPHDDVRVHPGAHIFGVGEVEAGLVVDEPDRDRSHESAEGSGSCT